MFSGWIDQNFVLDRWAEGYRAREIVQQLPATATCTASRISQIVRTARTNNDKRAISHVKEKNEDSIGFDREQFTRGQVKLMDAKFKARMLRAIRLGKESVFVGVYKSHLPSTTVPLRFTPIGYVSSASSISLCGDEVSAASDQSRTHARAGG